MGTAVRNPGAQGAAAEPARPRRAPGLELLGRYEDSGFKEPPYLARRADGQVVQLSELLHLVAEAADGRRDEAAIGDWVSERVGRRLTAENARYLIEHKLRPLGILAGADGRAPELERREAALALRHRRPFVSEGGVQTLARLFQPLFHAPIVLVVLAALVALDAWLFFDHGVAGPLRSAIYQPALLLGVFAATIAATAFHEVGHAAACRFGGARPGAIGAGVYLIWPAFYCDVTDSYRLSRRGRLRTDLGGVYFNAVFALLAAAAYFATGVEALLLVVVVQHFVVAQQLLPLLRFDGYYVLTDLTGVPDILSRVRPILRSLVPGRAPEPAVEALKPWVRAVTTLYLGLVVPLVVGLVAWVILGAPRLLATIFDSLVRHGEDALAAGRGGEWAAALLGGLESVALLLPCVAMAMTLSRLARLAVTLVRRWTGGRRRRQAVALAGASVAAAFLGAGLWPDGDYVPLRPGERGTVSEVFTSPLHVAQRSSGHAPATTTTAGSSRDTTTTRERDRAATSRRQAGRGGRAPVPSGAQPQSASPPASATPEPNGTAQATPEPTPTPTPIPQPGAGNPVNQARAVNTVDGSRLFQLAFDIQRIRGGGTLEHTNVAEAIASCQACRTIAIAVQVVIVMGATELAAPVNLAESLNVVCSGCQTLALAWQLVVTTGGEVELTQEALRRIAEIERQLAALEASDAPVTELRAAADALLADLREVVLTGLVPVEGSAAEEPAPQESSSAQEPEPTPTAAPEEPEPQEPTPPEETAAPEEAAEPEPTPTATPTAEPTAEPAPTTQP